MSQSEYLAFDPFDADMDDEKRFAIYQRARNEQPFMLHDETRRNWSVFRYEDVARIVKDHQTFTSVPEFQGSFALLFDDPPQHTRFRKVVNEKFSRQELEKLRSGVSALAQTLLREAMELGEIDFYTQFAEPLFMSTITEILGLPETDQAMFHNWSQEIAKIDELELFKEPDPRAHWDSIIRPVYKEVGDFLSPLVEQRNNISTDDLLGDLVKNTRSGAMLSDEELYELAIMVVLGGQEAAPLLLSSIMLLLDKYPQQKALLWSNPKLIGGTVQEVLRFKPPFRNVQRHVAFDTRIQGVSLKTGDLLTCWLESANRDRQKFEHAEEFDISRKLNPHLAFNRGIHMCLGFSLSRMLAEETLKSLLQMTSSFEICGTPVPFSSPSLNGMESLPLRFIPA